MRGVVVHERCVHCRCRAAAAYLENMMISSCFVIASTGACGSYGTTSRTQAAARRNNENPQGARIGREAKRFVLIYPEPYVTSTLPDRRVLPVFVGTSRRPSELALSQHTPEICKGQATVFIVGTKLAIGVEEENERIRCTPQQDTRGRLLAGTQGRRSIDTQSLFRYGRYATECDDPAPCACAQALAASESSGGPAPPGTRTAIWFPFSRISAFKTVLMILDLSRGSGENSMASSRTRLTCCESGG